MLTRVCTYVGTYTCIEKCACVTLRIAILTMDSELKETETDEQVVCARCPAVLRRD